MIFLEREDLTAWQQWFATFTYKPNFTFRLVEQDGGLLVAMYMVVEDSTKQFRPHEYEMKTIREFDYGWDLMSDFNRAYIDQRLVRVDKNAPNLVQVQLVRDLPPFINKDYARNFVRECLREIENHELDEWFRDAGELPFDPHANDKFNKEKQ